jgi:flagellar motor switch protein FliN/FliY
MAGKDYRVELADAPPPQLDEPIVWQQAFSTIEQPSLWIAAGKDLWDAVGRATLVAAGIDDVSEDDSRSTWLEVLNQTAGGMASLMTAARGEEVTATQGSLIATEPPDVRWTGFKVTAEDGTTWLLKAVWTSELAGTGLILSDDSEQSKPRDTAVSKTFDLLLEVALPVAVSFGRTSLKIKEVLKLNTGSIVELDRFITDPVEVIVNNCVIARGEVVVVDGNYGVRINHLASREERLRSGMAQMGRRGDRI